RMTPLNENWHAVAARVRAQGRGFPAAPPALASRNEDLCGYVGMDARRHLHQSDHLPPLSSPLDRRARMTLPAAAWPAASPQPGTPPHEPDATRTAPVAHPARQGGPVPITRPRTGDASAGPAARLAGGCRAPPSPGPP